MRGMSKDKYIGRYTVSEFHHAKFKMFGTYGDELSAHKIDKILKYCAERDWPAERMETYRYAKAQEPDVLPSLRYYDIAQDLLDEVHHGSSYRRAWPEYEGIPESKRTADREETASEKQPED